MNKIISYIKTFFNKNKPFLQVYFHDIKNKLGSIKFSLSLLKNPNISSQQKNSLIETVLVTIDKTIDMLNDYLDLERYKSDKFLKNEKINLVELINEIVKELEIDIKRKKVFVNIIKPKELPIIKSNKKWLKKALLNIIHNSIKYNHEYGEVIIDFIKEKRGYIVIIQDTGIGMSEEEKKSIFKKFYTTDETFGSGIGLSMAKTVIESFGGAIKVESEKNKGTKFFIYLPKISKKIKLKRIAFALSSIVIFVFLGINYFFCLFPQKVEKQISDKIIIYKLENGIIAKTNINDKLTLIAKKNLFGTKFNTKIILHKADLNLNTNNQKVKVIAGDLTLKNLGTKFETIKEKKLLASSVYSGRIKAKNLLINKNEGLLSKNGKIKKEPLPNPPKNIIIKEDKNHNIILSWDNPTKFTILTISKSKNFDTAPIYNYILTNKIFKITDLTDGIWYFSLQSQKDKLNSMPKIKKFLFLKNYYMALDFFIKNNLDLANIFVNKSLKTINYDSDKPYVLKAKILKKQKKYQEAISFVNKALKINDKIENKLLLAILLYKNKQYNYAIKILKNLPNSNIKNKILGLSYYKLNKFKKAKKELFKYLENQNNDELVINTLIKIFKKENNKLMVEIFKNKLKKEVQ
ncbi:hypothetical protein FE773_02860 [Caminibacter mediatlanticus TB-2]|uniref:histidine kinase n=2 Tax=Caminibacter mediatlanticus TB-2 TaxID=391592 RepID=A0ABX5V9X0_9BACT|nr:HAMP domain-containing sensor histidine kinase [Caminibacter mediatlanticus]QCT94152.1 hypothetical protein FE773_02860 [Caminibacter mediatlanticus TB-2]